jgi:hypothetical protein
MACRIGHSFGGREKHASPIFARKDTVGGNQASAIYFLKVLRVRLL